MSVATVHPQSTAATRSLSVRRYAFNHDAVGPDRHWLDDDLFSSHLVATLSAVIPAGERFVADAVRRQRDRVEGPMRHQIKAFVGQEHLHQREHDQFNAALAKLGYPTAAIDRASEITFAVTERLPPRFQVAMTAAIEHFTAVIAEHTLATEHIDAWQVSESARAFLAWHLVEELEHRAVAFDTMQAIGTSEAERVLAMGVTVALLAPAVVGGLATSLLADPALRRPGKLVRSLSRFRHSPLARRSFLVDLLSWNRPGFHPDERPIDDLMTTWYERLFGDDGLVTEHGHPRGRDEVT